MKIPKFRKKDSDQKKDAGAKPDPGAPQSVRANALDSILSPRGQTGAPAQPQSAPRARPQAAPPANAAPASGGDPLGKLALGGLRNNAPPAQPAAPPPVPTPEQAPPPSEQAQPEPSLAPVDPQPDVSDAPPDPLGSLSSDAPAPDPAADTPQADGEEAPKPEGDALAGLADAGGDSDGAGDDLLDIFRDAKEESEEGSLVKELDDVPISDLLTDVVSLSQRLGVTPSSERKPDAAPAAPEDDADDDTEPEVQAPTVRAADPEPQQQPDPAATQQVPAQPPVGPEQPAAQSEPEVTPAPVAPQQQPVQPQQQPQNAAPPAQPAVAPDPSTGAQDQTGAPPKQPEAPRQQLMHVLVIGLSLALVAGVVGGSRGATDLFTANPDATPAVLAYINEPVAAASEATAAPQPSIVPTAAPTPVPTEVVATATPVPTPTPTPAPTPGPDVVYSFDPMAPAYYNYTVESGDSLTSMSRQFGICPDHILWNNPPRTEYTPLYVGEHLTMPGIPGVVHIVEPGDSIASLAARYSVSKAAIIAFPGNHLEEGDDVRPGQRVLMPGGIPPEALLQDADAYEKTHIPSEDGLVWPYAGPVTTYFGEVRPNYIHYAIDVGGLGSYGQPVVSAAAGNVVFVGYDDPDYGNHVIVDHGDGRRTHYAHFQDVYVAQGQTVQQSQPLGSIGCTGASTGTHLHFELSQNGQLIDPLPLLP